MSAPRRRGRITPRNRAGTPRQLRRAPVALRLLIGVLLVAGVALAINGVYQVVRKPTELFFPVSGVLAKTPQESWREYGPAFRRYATPAIAPELLAALAQVEGSGIPRGRHVPDHRRYLRRGAALLHSPPRADARRCVARLALVLVQRPVPADRAARRDRADCRVPGSEGQRHPGKRPAERSERAATPAPGRGRAPVRSWRRGGLRAAGLSLRRRGALRRSRPARVPAARRLDEGGV